MWTGIILLGYCVGIGLFMRFFQAVHQWDEQIEAMDYPSGTIDKKRASRFRKAA